MTEATDQPAAELTWRVHPARHEPGRALVALMVIAAIALLASVLYQAAFWGVFVVGLMLLILQRFFFPSRFEIFDDAIVAHYAMRTLRLPWTRIRRFAHDERGGFLSTRARRTWMDSVTGMHLLFDDQRDDVIRSIREHIAVARQADQADARTDAGNGCSAEEPIG